MSTIIWFSNLSRSNAYINNPFREGEKASIEITTTDVDPGSKVYWNVRGVDVNKTKYNVVNNLSDADIGGLDYSGEAVVNSEGKVNLSATFNLDGETEADDIFYLDVFSDEGKTNIIGKQHFTVQDGDGYEFNGDAIGRYYSALSNPIKEGTWIRFPYRYVLDSKGVRGNYWLVFSGEGIDISDFGNSANTGFKTPSGGVAFPWSRSKYERDVEFVISSVDDGVKEGTEKFTVNLFRNNPLYTSSSALAKPLEFTLIDASPTPTPTPTPTQTPTSTSNTQKTETTAKTTTTAATTTNTVTTTPKTSKTETTSKSATATPKTSKTETTSKTATSETNQSTTGKDIYGNKRSNRLTGTQYDDYIDGDKGNDVISALGGDDIIIGGKGRNTITTGSGMDMLIIRKKEYRGRKNYDVVTDFNINEDYFYLDQKQRKGINSEVYKGDLFIFQKKDVIAVLRDVTADELLWTSTSDNKAWYIDIVE